MVLADVETALKLNKAIVFRAAEHVQDFLPMSRRDILKFEGCAVAWQRALAEAGIGLTISPSPRCTTASPSPN
jgi:acetyl-CoA C-acetyltransferase